MIRIYDTHTTSGTATSLGSETPFGLANAINRVKHDVAAALAALIAELEATQPPRPGPDGKVNTSAQQAYDERVGEIRGKISRAKRELHEVALAEQSTSDPHVGRMMSADIDADQAGDEAPKRLAATRHLAVPVLATGLNAADEPSPGADSAPLEKVGSSGRS